MANVTVTITEDAPTAGTWAPTLRVAKGKFNITVATVAAWVGTVRLQRSFNDGSTWYDVETWTADVEKVADEPEGAVDYRIGMNDTDWTSGQVLVRLGQAGSMLSSARNIH